MLLSERWPWETPDLFSWERLGAIVFLSIERAPLALLAGEPAPPCLSREAETELPGA